MGDRVDAAKRQAERHIRFGVIAYEEGWASADVR
jgi:hypothetical protein